MKAESKLLDDIARVAGGAVSILSSLSSQMRADLRDRVDVMSERMDLVPREEVERMKAMLQKARLEQEELKKRVASLEQKLNGKNESKNAVNKKKTRQTKTAKKK